MTHYTLNAPVTYTDKDGKEQTRFTRVGAIFENKRKDSGEAFLSIKLDFPVGVTELVAFLPKDKDDQNVTE